VSLEAKVPFEEFLDPEEQHIAVVDEEHVTAEGRLLSPGDRITPAQARREKVLFHVEPWPRTVR